MSAEQINLNLTRKWRSKNFDQIVGQDLSVRMLKNSLYLKQFFPVYLFSGQRGCGKTSTARVFASAINCANLSKFQKDPRKYVVPCLTCDSCKAMKAYSHPDFIEIDAASHTGVDNVRQIIESSSFMPLMGSKRIYLIDEAHMLSKAAFNAFLKILEEPPSSVIFILATTSPEKIIETVRSRCFQIFFKPVEHACLVNHLKHVCGQEEIPYDESGLGVIVNESQGSVRDSLNILEQVRFSAGSITRQAVQNVLGHIDDERLLQLFKFLLTKSPQSVLQCLQDMKFEFFSAEYVWKKLIEIIRISVWIKHGVSPVWSCQHTDQIAQLIKSCSWERLNTIMQLFYDNEVVFIKTTEKHSLLEMILIQIAKKNDVSDKSGASSAPQRVSPAPKEEEQEYEVVYEEEEVEYEDDDDEEESSAKAAKSLQQNTGQKKTEQMPNKSKNESNISSGTTWDTFLSTLDKLEDPLLSSIFKNGEVSTFDTHSGDLEVIFLKRFSFFQDSLKETESLWLPVLKEAYAQQVKFKPLFTKEGPVEVKKTIVSNVSISSSGDNQNKNMQTARTTQAKKNNNAKLYKPAFGGIKRTQRGNGRGNGIGKMIDVSDVVAWKKANMILKYFSGTVTEIQES